MSATAQMTSTKAKSEAATWTTLFNDVDTSTSKSVLFMKKLLALGVSNILYWRQLLPEEAFGERMVGANPLKILRNEKECAPAMKIISWIKASFEPITKGWLRNLYLVIRDEENKSTIETYTFKFKYTEEKVDAEVYRNSNQIPSSDVEGKTMQMLSNISAVVKPLGPAPFPCMVSIDMDFHQSETEGDIPDNVEVPGFKLVPELSHIFDGKKLAVNLGDVDTHHHDCKLQIRTSASRFNMERSSQQSQQEKETKQPTQGDAGNDSTAPQSTTGEPSNDTSAVSAKDTSAVSEKSGDRDAKTKKMKSSSKKRSSKSLDKGSENKASDMMLPSPVEKKSKKAAAKKNVSVISEQRSEPDHSINITCPCEHENSESSVVACVRCGEYQHLVCYGFPSFVDTTTDTEMLTKHFLCFNCSPYLQDLNKFSRRKFTKVCKLRQVLVILDEETEEMDQSAVNKDTQVRKTLVELKVISRMRKSKLYKLNQGALNKANETYFDGLTTVELWGKPRETPPTKKFKRWEH